MATILVIEDDQAIREAYATVLLAEGHRVMTAEDGEKGLSMAQEHVPDLILLDVMMPRLDGLSLLSKLRSTADGEQIKVIVLTNMGDAETATKVFKLGANDYAVKAELTPKEVVGRIHTILGI
jgi:DNA-binding response OmpR family regulator